MEETGRKVYLTLDDFAYIRNTMVEKRKRLYKILDKKGHKMTQETFDEISDVIELKLDPLIEKLFIFISENREKS